MSEASLQHTVVELARGISLVTFQGTIADGTHFNGITREVTGKTMILSLAQVERINSHGIRAWSEWVEDLYFGGFTVVLLDCPPPVVALMALVQDFATGASVYSVLAPYYCRRCARENDLRVVVAELGAPVAEAPARTCPTCGEPLAFEEEPEHYFKFVSVMERPPPDKGIEEVLRRVDPP